jgi:hypothetical protein
MLEAVTQFSLSRDAKMLMYFSEKCPVLRKKLGHFTCIYVLLATLCKISYTKMGVYFDASGKSVSVFQRNVYFEI